MLTAFPKTLSYLNSVDTNSSDPLDQKAKQLLFDEEAYERASQALRRRFSRGAEVVEGIDKAGRFTRIKREKIGGKYHYYLEGVDGIWNKPEERIWIVAMYALWQQK
jgi:hypothetical protein